MMIRIKSTKVLLVAPDIFSVEALSSNKQIKHITSVKSVFPAIYEMSPNLVVFDYDYLSKDIENVLRRMRANSFYDKIKVCCYKSEPDTKVDSFLKTLGVNYVISKEQNVPGAQKKSPLKGLLDLIDLGIVNAVPSHAY